MSNPTRSAVLQFDIKSVMIATAFVAVVVQLCLLIWAVLPERLPYVIYGLHMLWTGSWLAVLLAAAWFLVQSMRDPNARKHRTSETVAPPMDVESRQAARSEVRRQFMLAVGWGVVNQLLWFGFTMGTSDNDAQWLLAVVYLQTLPAAWLSQVLQFRRYMKSPDLSLRVMYLGNSVGFVLPLLSVPYNIIRSM